MRPFALLASLGAVRVCSLNLNFRVLVRFVNNRSIPIYINETSGEYLPDMDIIYDNPNYLEDYIVAQTPSPAASARGSDAAGSYAADASSSSSDAGAGGVSDASADADVLGDSGAGTDAFDGAGADSGAGSAGDAGVAGDASDTGGGAGSSGGTGSAGGFGAGSSAGGSSSSGSSGSSSSSSSSRESSPQAPEVTSKYVEDYIQDANNYLEHYDGYMTPKGLTLMSTQARSLREAAIKKAFPKILHVDHGLSREELQRRLETKATPHTALGRALYTDSAPEWYNNFIVNSLEAGDHHAPAVKPVEAQHRAPIARHVEDH